MVENRLLKVVDAMSAAVASFSKNFVNKSKTVLFWSPHEWIWWLCNPVVGHFSSMVSSRGLTSGVLVPISISLIRLWYRRTEFLKTFSFNSSSLKMVLSNGEKKCGFFTLILFLLLKRALHSGSITQCIIVLNLLNLSNAVCIHIHV